MHVNKTVETGLGLEKKPNPFISQTNSKYGISIHTFRTQGKSLGKLGIWPCCNLWELKLMMTMFLLGHLGI